MGTCCSAGREQNDLLVTRMLELANLVLTDEIDVGLKTKIVTDLIQNHQFIGVVDDDIIRYAVHMALCSVRCAYFMQVIELDTKINAIDTRLRKTTNPELNAFVTYLVNKYGLVAYCVSEIIHTKHLRKDLKHYVQSLVVEEWTNIRHHKTDNYKLWDYLVSSVAENYIDILNRFTKLPEMIAQDARLYGRN